MTRLLSILALFATALAVPFADPDTEISSGSTLPVESNPPPIILPLIPQSDLPAALLRLSAKPKGPPPPPKQDNAAVPANFPMMGMGAHGKAPAATKTVTQTLILQVEHPASTEIVTVAEATVYVTATAASEEFCIQGTQAAQGPREPKPALSSLPTAGVELPAPKVVKGRLGQ